jgi:HD superfamily phosphohydrolase
MVIYDGPGAPVLNAPAKPQLSWKSNGASGLILTFTSMPGPSKHKIFNDPIYGFISVPDELTFQLLEHPWFQRLRRIKQLGLTNLVYPGALHTRFHHAMGAMHLMREALEVLRSKGHEITKEEAQAATIAILLHDIGHGPFSHALEHSIVNNVTHEDLSAIFMERLNRQFRGKLDLAIRIFKGKYKRKFFHQLVSSQLDMDRLDYLLRDSFYTGVSEGVVSSERIIKMLNVKNDQLVVESKGIYSVEKFIISRRLMYWQVYLHKTVLSAENLLVMILKRAKELAGKEEELFATPALRTFLYSKFSKKDFIQDKKLLDTFARLDDNDIMTSVKVWTDHPDRILSLLCSQLVHRRLFRVELQEKPFEKKYIRRIREKVMKAYGIGEKKAGYFVFTDEVSNEIYNAENIRINILFKDGTQMDVARASDQLNAKVLSRTIKKYFLCYPKEI